MTEESQIAIAKLQQQVADLVDRVDRGFADIKSNVTLRIENLERNKAEKQAVEELQKKVNDDIEKRVNDLEKTRIDFRRKIEDNNNYNKFIIGLGILILGMLIFYITGYHI